MALNNLLCWVDVMRVLRVFCWFGGLWTGVVSWCLRFCGLLFSLLARIVGSYVVTLGCLVQVVYLLFGFVVVRRFWVFLGYLLSFFCLLPDTLVLLWLRGSSLDFWFPLPL